jgi:hypothetical protein
MAGAADIEWPPYSDSGSDHSDEEEIPDLTLDEVGHSSLLSADSLSSPTKCARNDRNDNLNLADHSKYEEAEGGDGDRRQIDM